jgi:DNA replication protein DnaC
MKYEPINKASFLAGIDARIEAYRQANGIESVGVSLEQVTPDGHCRNCNKRHYIGNGTTQLECVDGNVCNPEKYNQVKQLWPSLSDRQIMREAGQFVCPNLTQNMRAEGLPEQKPFEKKNDALKNASDAVEFYGRRLCAKITTGSILISAPTGTGKTHLMRNLHSAVGMQGHVVNFKPLAKLTLELDAANRFSSERTKDDIISDLISCRLLILDDLGSEDPARVSFLLQEPLQVILDQCGAFGGFSVAITTNLTAKEICERYGDRIHSRILEACSEMRGGVIVKINNQEDHRKVMNTMRGAKAHE